MKALRVGRRRAVLVDVPDPQAEGDWVVIRIHAAPLCTEYKAFVSDREVENIGHEAVGEVVDVASAGPLQVGDRVLVSPQAGCGACFYCQTGEYIHCRNQKSVGGTLAQYIAKPAWMCPRLPDDMDYVHASLAGCALGPGLNAAKRMDVSASDTYLICGLGPVGLGALLVGKFRNARTIVVEPEAFRREKAREMGADHVLDPSNDDVGEAIRDLTRGVGVDKAVDCSGNPDAERLCLDATRSLGHVTFVGENGGTIPISPSRDFIRKGLHLHGSWHWGLHDFAAMMSMIRRSPLVDRLITHVLPMSRAQEAFELCAAHQTGKAILRPWE
jgi:threonine dehydrogenase-like Zn-dependent dehydrogenase